MLLLSEPSSDVVAWVEGWCRKIWVLMRVEYCCRNLGVIVAQKEWPFWLLLESVGIAIAWVEGCHQPSEYFGIYVDR